MSTLIESLERDIPRLEEEFGSDNQFVKDSKEQLRAMKANVGKTTQDVYRMQAVDFSPAQETGMDSAAFAEKVDQALIRTLSTSPESTSVSKPAKTS